MKTKRTLKDELEGWLAFDGYWFWHPDSGIRGSLLFAGIIIVALVIFST